MSINTFSQFNEDFSTTHLSGWHGDTSDFVITPDGKLMLAAIEPGHSTIYKLTQFPDSMTWKFEVRLDFPPSNNNKVRFILATDTLNPLQNNGLSLQLGENGSNDACRLLLTENDKTIELASGLSGRYAAAFEASFIISYDSNHFWSIRSKIKGETGLVEEAIVTYEIPFHNELKYFAISCTYTSSRKELFYFDDISLQELSPDTSGPLITFAETTGDSIICIYFDEAIHVVELPSPFCFLVEEKLTPDSVAYSPFSVRLLFTQPLPHGRLFNLKAGCLRDIAGNPLLDTILVLYIIDSCSAGDILINEVLFNPYPACDDFVECINHSSKVLNMKGLTLFNSHKKEDRSISGDVILFPGEIIAFTSDPEALYREYHPPDNARIIYQEIPALNNSSGNVSVIRIAGKDTLWLDRMDYNEDMHYVLIEDSEGVSLERIDLASPATISANWFSGSQSSGFATPGYRNTSHTGAGLGHKEKLGLLEKVFTPDRDGINDLAYLAFDLEKHGYLTNLMVYSDAGYPIRELANNYLIAPNGIITWDGIMHDGLIAPVGMYIIHYTLHHADGDFYSGRLVVIVGK